ncbi:MAG: hypothetical protein PHS14_16915 [Elusimicrobia bacterium]|nr:hypothetical protein [Elusimicrobiota bacterium]
MTTDTVTRGTKKLKAERRELYERCRERGITHDKIAAVARCSRTYVVHFFAARRSPRAIELAIELLLAGQQRKAS